MSNVAFVKKQGKLFYRQERPEILYILVHKHVQAWIQARRADDVGGCEYQLVLCELVCKYSVR